jgi:hypothetical protein
MMLRGSSTKYSLFRSAGSRLRVFTRTIFPAATRNFLFSTIVTLESPHRFTKFAGVDANGDVFGVNDRLVIEPRNTFVSDSLKTLDCGLPGAFRWKTV